MTKAGSGSIWGQWNTLKLLLAAAIFGGFIFAVNFGLDQLLLREHERPRLVIALTDMMVGLVAAGLFYLYGRSRRKQVLRRLETIADMNHHIRNALQVIAGSHYLGDHEKAVAAIEDAVERIQWALREVLPKV